MAPFKISPLKEKKLDTFYIYFWVVMPFYKYTYTMCSLFARLYFDNIWRGKEGKSRME